jgi:hypothetical protein
MHSFFADFLGRFVVCLPLLIPLESQAQLSTQVADVRQDGKVKSITALADGSQVLGGIVDYVNGVPVSGLQRLRADGSAVPGWSVLSDNQVTTTASDGTWLYLGGAFTVVNGFDLPNAARVSIATGQVDGAWRPAPNAAVTRLIVPASGGLVMAGDFTYVQELPRRSLVKVSTTGTGSPVETWRCDTVEEILTLTEAGSWLYVGGKFGAANAAVGLGGAPVSFLGRISPATGAVDGNWRPGPNWWVNSLSASGTHLYVGGEFTRMSNVARKYLARIPLTSAAFDPAWTPNLSNLVTSVCHSNGSTFVSGSFVTVENLPRRGFVKFSTNDSLPDTSWAPALDGLADAMIPDGAGGVWMGGRFHTGAAPGGGWARIGSGVGAQPQYPARLESRGSVLRLVTAGGWVYAGGQFDTVNGQRQPLLFRMDSNGNVSSSWQAGLGGFDPYLRDLEYIASAGGGPELILGGNFIAPDEAPGIGMIFNLSRIKAADGATQTGFITNPLNVVNAIEPWNGGFLIGGEFPALQPLPENISTIPYLGWVNAAGVPDTSFTPTPDGPVDTITAAGGAFYVGGRFTEISGLGRKRLCRFNGLNNIDLLWSPNASGPVSAIEVSGGRVFAGGKFTRIGRDVRRNLAELAAGGSGSALPWRPDPGLQVSSLRVIGSQLYVGGAFFDIAQQSRGKAARFNLGTVPLLDPTWRPQGQSGLVFAWEERSAGSVWAGGSFTGWDGSITKRTLIRLDGTANAAPLPAAFPPPTDDPPTDLLAAYFAANGQSTSALPEPLVLDSTPALRWNIRPGPPPGTLARVQWSTDLQHWQESGTEADGLTCTIAIEADGNERTARVTRSDGAAQPPLFLRVVVTAHEEVLP